MSTVCHPTSKDQALDEGHPLHIIMFYHSVISDWNNGNAHYIRGIVRELVQLGHHVVVYEPRNGWSIQNLQAHCQHNVVADFQKTFPEISFVQYVPEHLQLDEIIGSADVVIVHEWNDHNLVAAIGNHHRRNPSYSLLFHDTHHRSVTAPEAMGAYDLSNYDGVLAFGNVVKTLYIKNGWSQRAWTWHEAADTAHFYPRSAEKSSDLLWIGNWGDEERTEELEQYLFQPAINLELKSSVYGVRYPDHALQTLARNGIYYGGWLPNHRVPEVAATSKVMVHVPRRPYVQALPGIPTIRPFEAMACGIPLVSVWWDDEEELFTPGKDYLVARNPEEMTRHLRDVLHDDGLAAELTAHGLKTIQSRHTCAHRVRELLSIVDDLKPSKRTATYAS